MYRPLPLSSNAPGNGCVDDATAELNANVLIRGEMVFANGKSRINLRPTGQICSTNS